MKIKSLNLKKPRKKDLETTSEKINTTRAVQDEGLPEKSSWLNLEIQIGDKIMRLRDADNFLCRFQVNQNPDEQNDSNNKSFITEPSVQLTPVRPSTPNFMKQTLNSESRFKPFTQIPDDLSSIKPSKEALIQKIHEIKSNGKTVITHLNLLLEKQLKTQPKNFKKSTNKLIPKVSHHLRSLMTGILEFLPDHAIGLEKIFKIMVYTLETSLSFLDSQHSAQMELSNFYKGKQSEIEKSAKIIEDLKNENLFNSRASLQKIMKLENMVSKYKHMIKLYEMELENKTKIDYPMYDDLMFK